MSVVSSARQGMGINGSRNGEGQQRLERARSQRRASRFVYKRFAVAVEQPAIGRQQ
jgi:hypothetical protein